MNATTGQALNGSAATADRAAELTLLAVNRAAVRPAVPRSTLAPALLGGAIAAAAGLALGYFLGDRREPPAPAPESPVAAVSSASVFALGRLEPRGEIAAVNAPDGSAGARIKRLAIDEGDRVERDAILAVLDNEDRLLAERDTAESQVRKARAALAQARRVVESTRGELRAQLDHARATRETERSNLTRQRRLLEKRATSEEDLERAQLQFDAAEQSVREIDARLARYEAVADDEAVDVIVAREELAVAEATLAESRVRLDRAYVRAPFAGTILDVHKRAGEPVGDGALVDLGATDEMFARVDVYESDASRVRPNQAVVLTSAALAKPLRGTVERVGVLVKKQSVVEAIPAANTDARVVEVVAKLDPESLDAARRFVGLQVRVEFRP